MASVAQTDELHLSSLSRVELTEGKDAIVAMQTELNELASRCGQSFAQADLRYFLSRPTVQKKRPVMLSFRNAANSQLEASVFFFEYRLAGCRAGVFATDDTTGRRNLMAAADRRSSIAFKAVRELMRRGAHTVLVSFQHEAETVDPALVSLLGGVPTGTHWASRERETQGYLPLRKDFEESIAPMGKKTRINLRYYRKMVENELGARFAPEASISREDFLELNRASAFAVSDETAVWRHESLKLLAEPVLAGIKDRDGRWISMAGGRRFNRWLEVHWLMNRNDLPAYSLSTVIRAYLIDNEAALGSERIYFQGGTIHSIRSAFQAEKVTDLVVMRRALRAPMRLFVERMLPEDNMLRQVLLDKELEWRPVHP